ncbi:MAG: T9SS type A sorting domain-containing protein [Bacteroidia bacterium]|nr:T9SS type A sorting domain-containing protein [Bacteroidia bacterium]
MRCLCGVAFLLCLMAIIPDHSAIAQVEWKDPLTCGAIGDQINPTVARPSQADYTIVFWQDDRGQGSDFDIYCQKIDNFTGLPQWLPPEGVLVCGAAEAQIEPRAAYDSLGGVIVTWLDARNGYYTSIYAQRLDATTGALDPNWLADGMPVRDLDGNVEHVRIAGNSDGAYITWLDHRSATAGSGGRLVYAQYILSATGNWPQGVNWVQNGIPVSASPGNDQEYPEIARDYIFKLDANQVVKAGCVIAYQDQTRHGNGVDYWNVMATNIDADGVRQYGGNDIPMAAIDADQLHPRIVCGGAEATADQPRAIVVWQDARQDPNAPLYDIMAQVIYASGTVSNPGTGEVICDMGDSQILPIPVIYENPQHSPNYGDPYIPYVSVVWQDLRDAQTSGIDLYGGTFDTRFITLANPSGSAGELVCALGGDQTEHALDHINGGDEVNIAWRTPGQYQGGYANADIHHQKATIPSWSFQRPYNGWPVTEAKGDQVLPEVSGEVMVFQDRRRQPIVNDNRNDWDIHCQLSGECVGPAAMRWRDMWAKVTNISDAQSYRMATDEEHNVFVVWDEIRYPNQGRQVYIQKFDKHGVPRWDLGGVLVSDPSVTDNARHADVSIDGSRGAQVAWQQYNLAGSIEEVVYGHIRYDGVVSRLTLTPPATSLGMIEPSIVFTPPSIQNSWDEGAIIVAINQTGAARERVLYRMDVVSFAPVASPPPIPMGGTIPEYFEIKIVSDGDGGVHILSRTESTTVPPTKYINVTSMVEDNVYPYFVAYQDEGLQYTEFNGYDIDVDLAWPVPHRPILVYAMALPSLDPELIISSYDGSQANAGTRFIGIPWPDGGIATASQPSIVSDNYDRGNVGGMLIAWNQEYVNGMSQLRNRVLSEHVYFYSNTHSVPQGGPLVLSMDLTEKTWPDIARMEYPIPGQEPLGMVVWQGGGETSSCSPPRPTEIYSQLAGYEVNVDRGLYWTQEMMVAPGPGMYHQLRPTIQPSDDGTFSTFWLDTWGGTASPMGTRMYRIDDDNIGWKKRSEKASPLNLTASVYPNPVGTDGAITVLLSSEREQYTRVFITNALGRTVAQLHDGVLREGLTSIAAGLPRGQLPSGTYFVSAITAGGRTLTSFIVLR